VDNLDANIGVTFDCFFIMLQVQNLHNHFMLFFVIADVGCFFQNEGMNPVSRRHYSLSNLARCF
jgi:hypothetical protein